MIMLEKIEDIKKEIDNLDTYTVYTGAGQPDKCCVEFKEVKKIINKHMSGKEQRMSVQVNEFRHIPGKNDAEYIRLLKETLETQKQITKKAVAKVKELSRFNDVLDDIKAEIKEQSFEATEKYSEEPFSLNYTVNVLEIIDKYVSGKEQE